MKETFGVALVGCGVVGGGTATILTRDISEINVKTGLNLVLKKVVDLNFDHAKKIGIPESLWSKNLDEALADPEIKLVVELVGGLTFAKTVVEKALNAGRHVVTANKALLATYGAELFALARKNKVSIGFEASCAGGIPVLRTITEDLMANRIDAVYGIMNGTCNFILTEMTQKGVGYAQTLKEAQALGYAEADPTFDVSGMDTAHKLTVMGSLALGRLIDLKDLRVQGIHTLDAADIALAGELGYSVKLIASAERIGDQILAQVRPTLVSLDNLLGRVWGSFNAVSLYSSSLGHSMYYGRGAGAAPTASAVVGDIIGVASGTIPYTQQHYKIWPDQIAKASLADPQTVPSPVYLRFELTQPGQGAAILDRLATAGVKAARSQEISKNDKQYLLVITVAVTEKTLNAAMVSAAASPPVILAVLGDRAEFAV